jgi:hypothetical protein
MYIGVHMIWSFKIEENFVAREWVRRNSDEAMGERYIAGIEKPRLS